MAGSILSSMVEDPPLPGGAYPKEHVRACLSVDAGSVASVAYSFTTSFTAEPYVNGGLGTGDFDGDIWLSSKTANGFTLNAATQDRANASLTGTVDITAFPDGV